MRTNVSTDLSTACAYIINFVDILKNRIKELRYVIESAIQNRTEKLEPISFYSSLDDA